MGWAALRRCRAGSSGGFGQGRVQALCRPRSTGVESRRSPELRWSGRTAARQGLAEAVGEMLGDDTPRGGMDAHIGHRIEPVMELCIEVIVAVSMNFGPLVLTNIGPPSGV